MSLSYLRELSDREEFLKQLWAACLNLEETAMNLYMDMQECDEEDENAKNMAKTIRKYLAKLYENAEYAYQ